MPSPDGVQNSGMQFYGYTVGTNDDPVATSYCNGVYGWGAGIRTPTGRVRVCSPTVRRHPSVAAAMSGAVWTWPEAVKGWRGLAAGRTWYPRAPANAWPRPGRHGAARVRRAAVPW